MQLFMRTSVVSVINLEKKHVLGTASTARSLCLFDIWVLGVFCRDISLQSYGFIKSNLTLFVLYASVVLVHQSCYSFIVLNKKKKFYCDNVSLELGDLWPCEMIVYIHKVQCPVLLFVLFLNESRGVKEQKCTLLFPEFIRRFWCIANEMMC